MAYAGGAAAETSRVKERYDVVVSKRATPSRQTGRAGMALVEVYESTVVQHPCNTARRRVRGRMRHAPASAQCPPERKNAKHETRRMGRENQQAEWW